MVRNKARLVAKGFSQVEGLDFGKTFALIARLEAIRILLAFVSHHCIKLYQMDVKSAFLNGFINKLVFMLRNILGLKIRGILYMFIGCTRRSRTQASSKGLVRVAS